MNYILHTTVFVVVSAVVYALGLDVGARKGDEIVQKEFRHVKDIVKHTEAYFHPDTGEFTWPDKK